MSLQFTLFLRSRIATVKHMHRVSFRTLHRASRMKYGFYVFISKAGGYLQKAICCIGIWTTQSWWIQYGLKTEECSSNPEKIKKFFILWNVHTDTLAQSVSYSMGNYGSFQGNKQTELEAYNSEISAKFNSESSRDSNPTYALMTYTGKTTYSCLPRQSISINVPHSLR
jgi:hypothetical protein